MGLGSSGEMSEDNRFFSQLRDFAFAAKLLKRMRNFSFGSTWTGFANPNFRDFLTAFSGLSNAQIGLANAKFGIF